MYFQRNENQPQNTSLIAPNFTQANSLIRKNKPVSHKIGQIKARLQNLELKLIVVEKQQSFKTTKGIITQCLVADETGSIFMNFYNETGKVISEGDILYMSGVYSSKYKEMILLYEGDYSLIKRVGRYFMKFDTSKNLSQESLENYEKTGQHGNTLKFADQ